MRDNQAETIALEDLNVKGLIQKKKLARYIADVAWGRFIEYVQYKADWLGKNVIFCDRFTPSSKQCSCGNKNNQLTLADRTWTCPECKLFHDRDQLAAKNIKRFALQKLAESSGSADNVECPSTAIPISVGAVAKGVGLPA